MKGYFYFLCLIALIIFSGCSGNNYQEVKIKKVLEIAGKNRAELRKVIDYYKRQNNTLKLQAAYYMIGNLDEQYHYEGYGIFKYRENFERMDSLLRSGHGIFNRSWDSLQRIYPPPQLNTVGAVLDASMLKANFLIKNIEDSFKAWQYPWARNMNFNDFCKYLLPYKLVNEEPELWKSMVQKEYSWVLDSMKGDSSSLKACLMINRQLKRTFYINARVECAWNMNYSDLKKTHTGKCSDATQLTAYVMRAMGIPVTMDYTPFWANKDVGHQWNSLLLNNKNYFFVGSESDPGKNKIVFTRSYWIRRKRAKVFRLSQEKINGALASHSINDYEIPQVFSNPRMEDVTRKYVPTADVNIKLNGSVSDAKFVYLCIFNDRVWRPIAWAKVGYFNRVTFKDMGLEIVYLPAYYQDRTLVPAGMPFILQKNGVISKLVPKINMKLKTQLYQKYPEDKTNYIFPGMNYELFYWNNKWISLGRKKADKSSLTYNVPFNSLFWLRNLDKGKQERIFTYEKKSQIWW